MFIIILYYVLYLLFVDNGSCWLLYFKKDYRSQYMLLYPTTFTTCDCDSILMTMHGIGCE